MNIPSSKHSFPVFIGIAAFIYLACMSVRSYSGVFISTDSADFLMGASTWVVVQPYGYPLYMLLGHLVNLLPGNLAANMTILLSALPAAITVMLVYLIVDKLTNKSKIALISSLVLLSTVVFLTEATVTKGYALTAMFMTLAYYSYIKGWKYRIVIFLGLATAVHVTAGIITLLWLVADRRWNIWVGKPGIVYILCGALPYVLIPVLMSMDTPRYLAGEFTLGNLKGYWSGTGQAIIGMLSVFDVPMRWWFLTRVLLISTGVASIALLYSLREWRQRHVLVLIAAPLFMLWYVATCLDMQVWTYLSVGAPFIAILVGLGLSRMEKYHSTVVGITVVILIVANFFFMNAYEIDKANPLMKNYSNLLWSLPDGSAVVVTPGGWSLGLFYTIEEGKELIPVVYAYFPDDVTSVPGMKGYDTYLTRRYGVQWSSTLDAVTQSLETFRPVYFMPILGSQIADCFVLQDPIVYGVLNRVIGLTGESPMEGIEVKYW